MLPYAPIVRLNAALGTWFAVTVNTGTTITITDPENGTTGQVITITIQNANGGALAAVRWGGAYKAGLWRPLATGNNRSLTFAYDGTHWVEIARTTVDVPN